MAIFKSSAPLSFPLQAFIFLVFFGFTNAPLFAQTSGAYQNASMQDFSKTLETPAGRHGFLQTGSNGHFVWKNGERMKFWGVNVSSTRLNISPEEIETVVKGFARAGLNMVRLEAIDNRNCLLGKVESADSLHFDREYLDRLDHWMDSLRRHGIYYYLDLLDFRTFKSGDNALHAEELDRAARPYAIFDSFLIQLQKDYAFKLLTHRNPYSGLRPIDDTAFALIEICNEHGFFLYPEKLEKLLEPYASDLNLRWISWLKLKYGTRENLSIAWGNSGQMSNLRPEEDLEKSNVDLPLLSGNNDPNGTENTISRRAPARRKDGVEFLIGIQRAYFREMRDYLISIGVKIPITAVVSSDVVPDIYSVSQECDFTSENWYGEGINGDLQNASYKYYSNRNNLKQDNIGGFAPYASMLRWNNKPVVIREWATTWPNRSRAASVPEVLAYSSLQDFDAVLLFGYQTNVAPNGSKSDALNDFAYQSDPTVWGLMSLAGQAFLRGALAPAKLSVTLAYPFSRQFTWPQTGNSFHKLAWTSRLNSLFSDTSPSGIIAIPTGTDSDQVRLQGILNELILAGSAVSPGSVQAQNWRSDTSQIVRNSRVGIIEIRSPTLCIVSGSFSPAKIYNMGVFKFSTSSQFGSMLIYSLDGNPISQSHHLVFKMTTRASNSGEVFDLADPGAPSRWVLKQAGKAPVLTFGKPSKKGLRVWLASTIIAKKSPNKPAKIKPKIGTQPPKIVPLPAPIFYLPIEDGTWELEMLDGKATLNCDTPNLAGQLQEHPFITSGGIQIVVE